MSDPLTATIAVVSGALSIKNALFPPKPKPLKLDVSSPMVKPPVAPVKPKLNEPLSEAGS